LKKSCRYSKDLFDDVLHKAIGPISMQLHDLVFSLTWAHCVR